jgi:hypothetical protein
VTKLVVFGCYGAILAVAQEKITDQRAQPSAVSTASTRQFGGELPASCQPDVKVLGSLRYGETSPLVDCSAIPRCQAFLFDGYGGRASKLLLRVPTERPS